MHRFTHLHPLATRSRLPVLIWLFAFLSAVVPPSARAQGVEDRIRYLVGTIDPDGAGAGQARAYLLWQAQEPEVMRGRSYRVFAKPGRADSPSDFREVGQMKLLIRGSDIDAVLTSNPGIVGDLTALEQSVDDLFEGLLPSAGLSLGTKLSALLLAARSDAAVFAKLQLLSRVEPGVAICLGLATAVPLENDGVTTYELRETPAANTVSGRVTVDPNNLLVLPAPGRPIEVPETSAEGHLNARLRWGSDDDLRLVGIHQYGYNLYRLDRAVAESNGFHTSPPEAGELATLVEAATPGVARVNLLPVLPPELLTPAEAADLVGDPETFFLHDDNRRFTEGGVPFQDGEQYWYFVTARDILGRDGETSQGTLITMFDRMKPRAPAGAIVENFFHRDPATGIETRHLEISWLPPDGPAPDGYRVYRWSSVPEIAANAGGNPETLAISPVIPHVPGTSRYRFLDDVAGSPVAPADEGKTVWYTVRAFKNAAAGRIYSPNSPSAFGVLRDREGPPPATNAGIEVTGLCPQVQHSGTGVFALTLDPGLPATKRQTLLACQRLQPEIAWAQFIHLDSTAAGGLGGGGLTSLPPIIPSSITPDPAGWTVSPKLYFGTGNVVQYSMVIPAAGDIIACLVGLADGRQTGVAVAQSEFPPLEDGQGWTLGFIATVETKSIPATGGESTFIPHDTVDAQTGDLTPVEINFTTPSGAREWKIYRRVDLGPLSLLASGTSTGNLMVEDLDLPPRGALVCYYLQTFDEHGNPSPMQRLGCTRTRPRSSLPVPILAPVRRTGDAADPGLTLEWFCDPAGVKRFQILVGVEAGAQIIGVGSPTAWQRVPSVKEEIDGRIFYGYQTGEVGGSLAGVDGRFTLDLNVTIGHRLWFTVRAVSESGDLGELSNQTEFIWTEPTPPGPEVAWPARPLPAEDILPLVNGQLKVEMIDAPDQLFKGAAIRIGGIRIPSGETTFSLGRLQKMPGSTGQRIPTTLPGILAPESYLFDLGEGRTALPCVIYRYQIPSDIYPNVSGNIVQVSPLIDRIRSAIEPIGPQQQGSVRRIYDPFVEVFVPDPVNKPLEAGLYIKDTQGVVLGASYVYLLVRFKENGEIDRTIPIGSLNAQ